ncbi:hypothetical protein D3C71_2026780 [compost metagenome]
MHAVHLLLLQQGSELAAIGQQLDCCCRSTKIDGVAVTAADALIQRNDADINTLFAQPFSKRTFFGQYDERLHIFSDIGEDIE